MRIDKMDAYILILKELAVIVAPVAVIGLGLIWSINSVDRS